MTSRPAYSISRASERPNSDTAGPAAPQYPDQQGPAASPLDVVPKAIGWWGVANSNGLVAHRATLAATGITPAESARRRRRVRMALHFHAAPAVTAVLVRLLTWTASGGTPGLVVGRGQAGARDADGLAQTLAANREL